MSGWTRAQAGRLIDRIEVALVGDLPLFAGTAGGLCRDEVRLERAGRATLALLERLVRAAARRRRRGAFEHRGSGVVALVAPGGPALLAVRSGPKGTWRILLALGGPLADSIGAGIPAAEGEVGRAA